ncbi:FtsK/SpoIIIE domain-containing protein [Alkalihalobacillus oceani]|uniref:DNA translocase FtsK n=1 Tax=Halalkalibacter oceani TaxID=1653776 RepID=UPI00203D452B|nr:DNA translocase FtsK [Halalkalibacter oceani]MCM3759598.1 FtsK/SpoIIIE domain-containing protein [Halalkalibacter oceani]
MGPFYRLMKRLQYFFGGDEESLHNKRETARGTKSSPERAVDPALQESKVLYHYPKQGKFRFPLAVEPEEQKRKSSRTSNVRARAFQPEEEPMNRPATDGKEDKRVESKPKPEAVVRPSPKADFKLTVVPSPVYGFREREQTRSKMDDTLSVSPFPARRQEEIVAEVDSLGEQSEIEGKESQPITRPEEEREWTVQSVMEPEVENEWIAESDIGRAEENEWSAETEEKPTEENERAAESDMERAEKNEWPVEIEEKPLKEKEYEPGREVATGAAVTEEEYLNPTASAHRESEQEEALNEHGPVNVEDQGEAQVMEVVQSTPELQQQPELMTEKETGGRGASERSEVKKPAIPFNVMMLPQDRGKQRQKVEQRQTESVEAAPAPAYQLPGIQLLHYPQVQQEDETEWLNEQALILEEALQSFHVDAKVVHTTKGPSVTRYEIQPARGVKVNKVTGLVDDIKLALAAKDIRIEAPIPGKNTIGIEVPNRSSAPVFLREILRRDVFIRSQSPLTVALGLDISGQPIVTDLKKMPHGLVAGATGSGKSVCINSILVSLLYKATPDEVKILLIDPKMVELAPYNGVPHLVAPVITDAKQATAALKWVVEEMEKRYELFSERGVRDVGRYNDLYSEHPDKPAMPFILVVIDELADLMMVSPQDVEDSICRIAQKARACGIHLLLATQRPSVDVITGLIKANIPTRIAFSVSSQTDSRTILDMGGAERLLGRGDMLFHENGTPKPVRVQGTFVSDEEIEGVIAYVKKQRQPDYLLEINQLQRVAEHSEADDEYFEEACYYVLEQGGASASSLQRRFRIGYNRAARLIDLMEERGIISQAMGSKPRHVLVDEIELEERLYHHEM